jgi:hypothetical protein
MLRSGGFAVLIGLAVEVPNTPATGSRSLTSQLVTVTLISYEACGFLSGSNPLR